MKWGLATSIEKFICSNASCDLQHQGQPRNLPQEVHLKGKNMYKVLKMSDRDEQIDI